jgi:hypothetical protein
MQSVAHTGFGCPYCRSVMAEVPEEDYEEEEVYSLGDDESDMLRGFRLFFNNVYGEEHDEFDMICEDAYEQYDMSEYDEHDDEPNPNIPSTDFVAEKLREQGVTMESLTRVICLLEHDEYRSASRDAHQTVDLIYGKVRAILANFNPERRVEAPQPITGIYTCPITQAQL